MSNKLPKIIVILGPTASGKSDVAIKLAKEFNGEIISADSRQIYKGMDIGTGKVEGTWDESKKILLSDGVPHYAINICDPNEDFNVSDFKIYTEKIIQEILNRGKLPIICGGTGFWISSFVDNVDFPEVPPDKKLREKLEKESLENLLAMLSELDPQRAQTVDSKNKIRLIRAIEICKTLGKVPLLEAQSLKPKAYKFLQIGINVDKEVLKTRIQQRLNERFEAGMEKEVEKLHSNGVSWERLEAFGLEYRWISRYFQKKISLDEMKVKLYFDIIHYAKRQRTWFKKDNRIVWFEDYKNIKDNVSKFID